MNPTFFSLLAMLLAIVALLRRARMPSVIRCDRLILGDGASGEHWTEITPGEFRVGAAGGTMFVGISCDGPSVEAMTVGSKFMLAAGDESAMLRLDDADGHLSAMPSGLTVADAAQKSVVLPSGTMDKLPITAGNGPAPHPDAKRLAGPKSRSPIEPLKNHGLKLHQPTSEESNASESPSIA